MDEFFGQVELFRGLTEEQAQRLAEIASPVESLDEGAYLFLLGDAADRLFLLVEGKVELCFPLTLGGVTKDIAIEASGPGESLGWSALVKPHRFTLSARAVAPTRLVSFRRSQLLELFEDDPRIGYVVLTKISELVGVRLLNVQALWARELQRSLVHETAPKAE